VTFEIRLKYLENSRIILQSEALLLMTNRKLHMRFRLTPRSMSLDDPELYKFKFSENFADFGRNNS